MFDVAVCNECSVPALQRVTYPPSTRVHAEPECCEGGFRVANGHRIYDICGCSFLSPTPNFFLFCFRAVAMQAWPFEPNISKPPLLLTKCVIFNCYLFLFVFRIWRFVSRLFKFQCWIPLKHLFIYVFPQECCFAFVKRFRAGVAYVLTGFLLSEGT